MARRILAKPNAILKIEHFVISVKDTNFFLAKTEGEDDADQVQFIHIERYLKVTLRISSRPLLL